MVTGWILISFLLSEFLSVYCHWPLSARVWPYWTYYQPICWLKDCEDWADFENRTEVVILGFSTSPLAIQAFKWVPKCCWTTEMRNHFPECQLSHGREDGYRMLHVLSEWTGSSFHLGSFMRMKETRPWTVGLQSSPNLPGRESFFLGFHQPCSSYL